MGFESLRERLSQIGKDTKGSFQKMSGAYQINTRISEEQRVIDDLYAQIGAVAYDLFADNPPEGLEETFDKVRDAKDRISAMQDELRTLKGVVVCPECGKELPIGDKFCSACGARLPEPPEPEPEPEEPEEDVREEDPEAEDIENKAEDTVGEAGDYVKEVAGEAGDFVNEAAEKARSFFDSFAEKAEAFMKGAAASKAAQEPEEQKKAAICPECGQATEPGELFCSYCGARLSEEANDEGSETEVEEEEIDMFAEEAAGTEEAHPVDEPAEECQAEEESVEVSEPEEITEQEPVAGEEPQEEAAPEGAPAEEPLEEETKEEEPQKKTRRKTTRTSKKKAEEKSEEKAEE